MFKEVQDLDCDVTVALGGIDKKTRKANPTKVEGYYLGSKTVVSTKSKTGFAQIHIFQTSKGKLGVWGKTDSDRKLLNAIVGQMTKIEFDKMLPTPNGEMYKYRVAQDADNTIEVNISQPLEAAAEEEAPDHDFGGQQEEEEETPLEEEEAQVDELTPARPVAARVAAKAPDKARQDKVRALLGKRPAA